jgi:hypothetical protein
VATVYVLIRGDLLDVGLFYTAAPCVATYRAIGQKSAEAIVGVPPLIGGVVAGNELVE